MIIRYERDRPGEMIHLDIKKLGRFERAGHRATGDRTAGRSHKGGWDFLHVCIDAASRLAYTELLASERKEGTATFPSAPSTGWDATASPSSGS
ncbi:hypothetical protein KWG63_14670 [Brevundimonas nasdae]|uniref:Integrase catalytic domain-containing protein n=1 Tax=Brevundimonas nasdae TaxID=172043 RepID=A0ABX8THE3_9CAUL|nr:hypothetical protein [Brevundimonas nasdae]QYC10651.1 hypothetical protein KWG56_01115 [Brevundimonas nasdae]QYC13438.1 hypothetical protein KWG63_14670 [Brevundimonas nasdae]